MSKIHKLLVTEGLRFLSQALPRKNVASNLKRMNTISSFLYSSSSRDSCTSDKKYKDGIKNRILAASLPFVHNHGWTKGAISAGAESIGYPGISHGLFPQEGAELIQYFCTTCNNNLSEELRKKSQNSVAELSKGTLPAAFIQSAVEMRLRMITPYIAKWPQALGIMALPSNVTSSLANLLTLVDDICYYGGDRSVDFTWYSHRVALAGIYKLTELSLIEDKSEDYHDTWQFLERRIEDVTQLHNCLKQSEDVSQVAKEAITSAFVTARNILGMNLGSR